MGRVIWRVLFFVAVGLGSPGLLKAQSLGSPSSKEASDKDQIIQKLIERVETLEQQVRKLQEGNSQPGVSREPGFSSSKKDGLDDEELDRITAGSKPPMSANPAMSSSRLRSGSGDSLLPLSPVAQAEQLPVSPAAPAGQPAQAPQASPSEAASPPEQPGVSPAAPAGQPAQAPQAASPKAATPAQPGGSQNASEDEEREVTRVPVASVERGGSLLRPGQISLGATPTFTYNRTSHLILTGFSVIPLIILGTLESEKTTTNSYGNTFGVRYGLYKDIQVDLSVPFSYQTQSRVRVSNDSVSLTTDHASQLGFGDIGAGVTYQLLYEKPWLPDLFSSFHLQFPTGRSQFDIFKSITAQGEFVSIEDFVSRLAKQGIATGSGYWGMNFGLSMSKAYDPAVIFANFGYTYSIPKNATLIGISGEQVEGGILLHAQSLNARVQPGGALQFGLGFALSLNSQFSINLRFTDNITLESKQNGTTIPDSGLNVGQFGAGFTLALSRRFVMDFGGAIGITPDAPSFSVSMGLNSSFDSWRDLLPFHSWKDLFPFRF